MGIRTGRTTVGRLVVGTLAAGGLVLAQQGTARAEALTAQRREELTFGQGPDATTCVLDISSFVDTNTHYGQSTTELVGGDPECFQTFHGLFVRATYVDVNGIRREVQANTSGGDHVLVLVSDVGRDYQGRHGGGFELCRCEITPYTTTPK
jgi:hypothetical protein